MTPFLGEWQLTKISGQVPDQTHGVTILTFSSGGANTLEVNITQGTDLFNFEIKLTSVGAKNIASFRVNGIDWNIMSYDLLNGNQLIKVYGMENSMVVEDVATSVVAGSVTPSGDLPDVGIAASSNQLRTYIADNGDIFSSSPSFELTKL